MALKFIDKIKSKAEKVENINVSGIAESFTHSTHEIQEKVTKYLTENAESLKKSFSDAQLNEKLSKVAKKVGSAILYPVLLLYNLFNSPQTSVKDKMTIIAPLAYFILPMDLIPDAILGLGYTDDAFAVMTALKSLASSLTPEFFEQTKTMHKNLIGSIDKEVTKKIEEEIINK